MSAGAGSGVMRRGTLSRQLALRVAALVAVMALALGAISTLAVRQILMNQLAGQLSSAVAQQPGQQNGAPTGGPDPGQGITQVSCNGSSSTDTSDERPGGPRRGFGLPSGALVVYLTSGNYACGTQVLSGSSSDMTSTQISALLALSMNKRTEIEVPALGHYLAVKTTRSSDALGTYTTAVALPMSSVNSVLTKLLALEAGVSVVALAGSVVLSRALVSRSLAPLNRLASAATTVSNLELDRGEVSLAVRVPASEADPQNEVGQVGLAFNHMLNNVEGALAARQRSETKVRQFVADASHELRNPLAAIRGYSELTRRSRDTLPADTAFAMGRIEAESERMSKLVEDMLLLARLDNDPDLDLQPTDVVELVLNAVSDAQVAGREHTWQLDLPPGPVIADADAFRLHQVVVNLLGNARKHTPAGTVVSTGVRAEGRWAVITVSDNGPGIDASIRETLFERFARADVARAHNPEGSTGLGLAIVAAVMDAHHGTAAVDSTPGRTTFTLRLPLSGLPLAN